MVSPRQGLPVVRLGKTDDTIRDPLVAALGDVVALFPVRK